MNLVRPDTRSVAFYGRVSAARDDQQVSTNQQREEMLPTAELLARGGAVQQYVDESISAWSGAARPLFERLLGDMDSGNVAVVVTWNLNRIARQPADWYRFEALAIRHVILVRTRGAEYDLRNMQTRLTAGFEALMARSESDNKSEAVLRGMRARAAEGHWHGRVAYGYKRIWERNAKGRPVSVREEIQPEEAAVVVEIADRILAGDSLRSIAADLNARGVPSPGRTTSKVRRASGDDHRLWSSVKLRAVVIRHRNIGQRVDRGEVIGEGTWPAVLDEGVWAQVRAILADPTRRTTTTSVAKHLLSGIGKCGVCGDVLRAATNRGVASYKCSSKSHVTRNRRDLDALVTTVILGRLARPDAAALLRPNRGVDVREAVSEAAALRARLDVAADSFADGELDGSQLARITARLRPRLDAATARVRTVDDMPLLDELVGQSAAADVWGRLPLSRRRAVVNLLVEIVVLRAQQGARVFDPESVRITWKGQ